MKVFPAASCDATSAAEAVEARLGAGAGFWLATGRGMSGRVALNRFAARSKAFLRLLGQDAIQGNLCLLFIVSTLGLFELLVLFVQSKLQLLLRQCLALGLFFRGPMGHKLMVLT